MIKNINELRPWDKNPRAIREDDFERLKEQIKRLGVYKPLLITEDGTVLGGNMRYRALKELGVMDVWVSLVAPKTEAEKLEIALAHNDEASRYEDDKLLEMIASFPDFPKELFKVDLSDAKSLKQVVSKFGPDGEIPAGEDDGRPMFEGEQEESIKKFIITFGDDDFRMVLEHLQKVMQKHSLRNNTEAILKLLEIHAN